MPTDVTDIVQYGGDVSASSSGIQVELDEDMHRDSEGNVVTEFGPEDEVYFLVIPPPNVTVKGVKTTDGSDVQRIGTITRTRTQEMTFHNPNHLVDLFYYPAGGLSPKWFGRSSTLQLTGAQSKQVKADNAPCLGLISYSVNAIQYLNRPISSLSLSPGEEWPADMIIEYEEVK